MTKSNKGKGRKLIEEASTIFREDASRAFQREDYNLTIRRSQEVIELAAKGALQVLGVDFPKVHDVGDILAKEARSKGCPVDEPVLKRIEEASEKLASMRNASFYGEETYSEEQAREAYEEARFVLEVIENYFNEK